jgi:hypothetical protein
VGEAKGLSEARALLTCSYMAKSVKLVLLGLVGLLLLCLAVAYGTADKTGGLASSVLVLVGGSTADEGGSLGARTRKPTAGTVTAVPQFDDPSESERVATARVLRAFKEWTPFVTVTVLTLLVVLALRPQRSGHSARYWSMRGHRDTDGESMPRQHDYSAPHSRMGSST